METLQRTANRGSISTGYDIANSLKLEQDNSEYLKANNTFAYTTPTSSTTGTFSCWVKRTEIGAGGYQASVFVSGNSARYAVLYFENDQIKIYSGDSSFNGTYPLTNAVFRDTSAWYHIVLRFDSTDSTAANRLRLYINGEEQTWSTAPNITQNGAITFAAIGGPTWHAWGQNYGYFSPTNFFSGYLAEAQYIDGQALAPTEFGETDSDSGIWKPKEYDGTYGNAGYYLDFEDASNLGNDVSGNGFDFDLTNITSADQATDTPTNNFATQNVLWGTDRMPLMSQGATEIGNNVNAYRYSPATMGVANGKWYWEIKPTVNGNTLVSGAGIASNQTNLFFYDVTGNFVYHYDGDRYVNGAGVSSYGAAWATNDIIGFAYDADNWTLTCYVNNSSQGNLLAGQTDISSELFIPYVYSFGTHTYQTNFGGYTNISNAHTNTDANGYGSFVYTPPSGYYALCTKNLAEYG
nr:spry domain protein [uncultured Mediterranean phage uvMED]